jgi:hypothetical protein
MKKLFLFALLALAAVYAVVWGHEIGHSFAAYLLGCKAEPWRTGVTPLLWGSQGGAIDETCLARRVPWAVAAVALAGIAVNLLCAAGAGGLSRRCRGDWPLVATLLFALANAAEAFSYLVLNTVWLRADLRLAVGAVGGQWAFLGAGLVGAAGISWWLRRPVRAAAERLASPRLPARFYRFALALYAITVALAAAIERIGVG